MLDTTKSKARYLTIEYSKGSRYPKGKSWLRKRRRVAIIAWYRVPQIADYNAPKPEAMQRFLAQQGGYNIINDKDWQDNQARALRDSKGRAKQYAAMLSQQNPERCFAAVMHRFEESDVISKQLENIDWDTMIRYQTGKRI